MANTRRSNYIAQVFFGLVVLSTIFTWMQFRLEGVPAVVQEGGLSGLDLWHGLLSLVLALLGAMFTFLNWRLSTVFGVLCVVVALVAWVQFSFFDATVVKNGGSSVVSPSPGIGIFLALIGGVGASLFTLRYWRKRK